jgi:uncharacterized membrane protein YhaH (DUF805 family)
MTVHTETAPRSRDGRARREALWSLAMLPVFAVWTIAFVVLSGVVAEWVGLQTQGGEVVYIEAWLPWLAVSFLWVLPLVVGLVLAVRALRSGVGSLAKVALGAHLVALLLALGPSILDRLLHL